MTMTTDMHHSERGKVRLIVVAIAALIVIAAIVVVYLLIYPGQAARNELSQHVRTLSTSSSEISQFLSEEQVIADIDNKDYETLRAQAIAYENALSKIESSESIAKDTSLAEVFDKHKTSIKSYHAKLYAFINSLNIYLTTVGSCSDVDSIYNKKPLDTAAFDVATKECSDALYKGQTSSDITFNDTFFTNYVAYGFKLLDAYKEASTTSSPRATTIANATKSIADLGSITLQTDVSEINPTSDINSLYEGIR